MLKASLTMYKYRTFAGVLVVMLVGFVTLSQFTSFSTSVKFLRDDLLQPIIGKNLKNDIRGELPTERKCRYYVVFDVTPIQSNSKSKIQSLSLLDNQPPGWCVLVTGVDDPAIQSTCRHCIVVDSSWNEYKELEGLKNQPGDIDGHVIYKMAAYVYVLHQSAEWIYVTDRLVPVPYDALMRAVNKKAKTGLVYQGNETVFEPCSHFVDPVTWKGHGGVASQGRYNVQMLSNQSVYYVIDSCFKPKDASISQQQAVDYQAPIPYVTAGTYGPIDFKNVLVSSSNAWSLIAGLLPTKNTQQDHQMSMLVQRILWETEGTIGFIPAVNDHTETIGCSTCDLKNKMNSVESDFHAKLIAWKCEASIPVTTCLQQLVSKFVPDPTTLQVVKFWVDLLNKQKIKPILRKPFSEQTLSEKTTGTRMYFSPAKLFHVIGESKVPNPFTPICSKPGQPYPTIIPHKHIITNMVLVIIFNWAEHVKHIPLLNHLYGRHFKNVIYCSENLEMFENIYKNPNPDNPVTFVEARIAKGLAGYTCMSESMKTDFNVEGYLQMSDDVMLNPWNLEHLPYEKAWFQTKLRVANIDSPACTDIFRHPIWQIWYSNEGRRTLHPTFNDLTNMKSHPTEGARVARFMETIKNKTHCDRCILYESSDIFYLPRHLSNDFTFFIDFFSRNNVHLEIAVPTVIFGISPHPQSVERLFGNYLWYDDRLRYPVVYTKLDHYYHPFKFSLLEQPNDKNFYCANFLSLIDFHLKMWPHHIR